jgi:hypothetical protein
VNEGRLYLLSHRTQMNDPGPTPGFGNMAALQARSDMKYVLDSTSRSFNVLEIGAASRVNINDGDRFKRT